MLTGKELGQAIRSAIEKKGVKQRDVAAHFNVKPPSVSDWMTKGTISKDKLVELWRYFADVAGPEHWGLDSYPQAIESRSTGEPTTQDRNSVTASQMGRLPTSSDLDASLKNLESQYLPGFQDLMIPLLANAGAMGNGSDQLTEDIVIGRISVSPDWALRMLKPTRLEALRFIHGYGDSMSPTFSDGDVLLVDTGITEARIDGVYAISANDRIYIKRVRQRINGSYEISSDNPTVKTVDVLEGGTQVNILGRVLWAWNGKKL